MLSSAYLKNTNSLIENALAEENAGQIGIFYQDTKNETTSKIAKRVQFPIQPTKDVASEIILHQVSEKVNLRVQNQTQTKQFMRWFGDWQRHTKDVSKIQNADGSPIAPVVIDGFGVQNSVRIDSNAVTSIHGRSNAIVKLLADALNNYANGQNTLFYWNKKQAIALLQKARVIMPKDSAQIHDGYIASIRDAGSPVKPKLKNVTESVQFKRWFGNWIENPEKASKIVNADGSLEILKLYVEEMYNPSGTATLKRAYQLQNIESQQLEVTGSTNNRLAVSSTADIHTVADLFQAVKQRDKKFSPKAASQIVNEDGSPKIMYHQTDADFSVFRTESTGAGQCCSITVNVYGNLRIENGTPVVVGIVMKLDRSGSNLISNIRTIHARSDFAKQITDDSVLYLNEDKKRTRAWFQVCGNLNVPLEGTKFGFIRSITYQDTKINRYSVKSRSAQSYESEIERLKKQRDEAKRQIKLSKYQQVSPAGIKRMAQDLLAEYRSTANAEELIDTLNKSDSFLNQTCFFNLRYTVRYMVEKLAAPPSRLEIGSARKTPLTPSPAKCGRRSVSGMTTMPFRKMEKKMA